MSIRYSDLSTTTEIGATCVPCFDYTGMVDCPYCGSTFCVFCSDYCPCCNEEIVY